MQWLVTGNVLKLIRYESQSLAKAARGLQTFMVGGGLLRSETSE